MIGNLLTRGLVMILGYAYPAYECFKTVEKNKPEIDQLRFWCQYWILVALMTVFERVGDTFVSWVPMYSEAKLAFIIYLWYPRTKGTTYVYESFFKPYVAKHETEIDRNLMELRTRAGDMAFMYFQKVAIYGQTRIFEILQFVAAQSNPRSRAPQPRQPATRARQPPPPPAAPHQPPAKPQATELQNEEPPSPTSSTSSTQPEKEAEEELHSSKDPSTPPPVPPAQASTPPVKKSLSIPANPAQALSPLKKSVSLPAAPAAPPRAALPAPESSSQSTTNEPEAAIRKTEPVPASPRVGKTVTRSPRAPQETVMEETIRVTRGRLRKTRATSSK